MTRVQVSALLPASIDEAFAYFDDPDNMLEFNEHAERFDVTDVQPDGRRTLDIVMRAGAKVWMQTYEQVVREPPSRLTTRGWTWTTRRDDVVLAMTTDRLFSSDGDATRVDVSVDSRTQGRPFRSVLSWLQRDAFKRELERQLSLAAERLAAKRRAV